MQAVTGCAGGGTWAGAYGINRAGQVVGSAETLDGKEHAFLYDRAAVTGLGKLPGGDNSSAWAVNDTGLILGEANIERGPIAPFSGRAA